MRQLRHLSSGLVGRFEASNRAQRRSCVAKCLRFAPWRAFLSLLALALVGGLPRAAPASPPSASDGSHPTVGRAPLSFSGHIDARARDLMERHFAEGSARAGDRVVPVVAGSRAPSTRCDLACLVAEAKRQNLGLVLITEAREEDRNYTIDLRIVDVANRSNVVEAHETCHICSAEEAADLVSDATASLLAKLWRRHLAPSELRVESNPKGAAVLIDGTAIGSTPLRHEVAPGPHRIELMQGGKVVATRRIETTGGASERLWFELQPHKDRRPFRLAGAATLGASVLLLGSGATLFVVDGRPYRRDCAGDNVDAAGHCRFALETTAAAATLTALGVAAAATGIGLLVVDRRRPASNLRATLFPHPYGVTLRARF